MTDLKMLNLQLFAEGEGGEAPQAEGGEPTGEIQVPDSIPVRARENYRKAAAKTQKSQAKVQEEATPVQTEEEPVAKPTYAELIKSDEYKAEHQEYMEKTISDRLKKYKGLEESYGKANEVLGIVAQKYGLDPNSESFLDDIKAKTEADDAYFEDYAMEHGVSTAEARRIVGLEQKVARAEEERKMQETAAAEEQQRQRNMERYNHLQQNAALTKQRFPDFDLETEMRDERFARLCAVNNDDTTAAYMACHWSEIIPRNMQLASQQAAVQTANAIASGQNRPRESGLSTTASAVVETDFSKMDLKQIRAYAEAQRQKKR